MASVAEELPREIERVMTVRTTYESLRGMQNVMVEPTIALMSADIIWAINASTSGDVIEMLRAYEALKGWKE